MKVSVYSILVYAFLLGCSGNNQQDAENTSSNVLVGTEWEFVSFTSMDDAHGIRIPDNREKYELSFVDDSTVSMTLNCNKASGRWVFDSSESGENGRLEFGPIATTKMLCPPPSLDEFLVTKLQYVRGFTIKNDSLFLSLMADGGIFVWEKPEPNMTAGYKDPDEGGPRNFIIADEFQSVDMIDPTSLEQSTTFTAGDLFDNLGCEMVSAKPMCYVQPLGGGPVGYINAMYLEPAVGPDGLVPVGYDDSALRLGEGEYDAMGKIKCVLGTSADEQWCDFKVARSSGGYATVLVERANMPDIIFYFSLGKPIGVQQSEADWQGEFSVGKKSDHHYIEVGDNRFEIPEALVLGG